MIEQKLENSYKESKLYKEKQLRQDIYSRRENLKFTGIPEEKDESNEQLITKVRNIFSNDLGITDSKKILFQRCHRLGKKLDGQSTPRDIIARFVYFPDGEKVWEQRSKLKGTNIVMNEDFPDEILQRRSQLYKVFKLAREKHFKVKMVADFLIINGTRYTVDSMDKLPPEIHPKAEAERYTDNSVLFYGGYSVLSNFYSCCFVVNGQRFTSVEQYFQYEKAKINDNTKLATDILTENDPKKQFQLGKKIKTGEKWNEITSKNLVEVAVKAKFEQNDNLLTKLLNTGNKTLIQCNPHDKLWANGLRLTDKDAEDKAKWKGQNVLGEILCAVRESLKEK